MRAILVTVNDVVDDVVALEGRSPAVRVSDRARFLVEPSAEPRAGRSSGVAADSVLETETCVIATAQRIFFSSARYSDRYGTKLWIKF